MNGNFQRGLLVDCYKLLSHYKPLKHRHKESALTYFICIMIYFKWASFVARKVSFKTVPSVYNREKGSSLWYLGGRTGKGRG